MLRPAGKQYSTVGGLLEIHPMYQRRWRDTKKVNDRVAEADREIVGADPIGQTYYSMRMTRGSYSD